MKRLQAKKWVLGWTAGAILAGLSIGAGSWAFRSGPLEAESGGEIQPPAPVVQPSSPAQDLSASPEPVSDRSAPSQKTSEQQLVGTEHGQSPDPVADDPQGLVFDIDDPLADYGGIINGQAHFPTEQDLRDLDYDEDFVREAMDYQQHAPEWIRKRSDEVKRLGTKAIPMTEEEVRQAVASEAAKNG